MQNIFSYTICTVKNICCLLIIFVNLRILRYLITVWKYNTYYTKLFSLPYWLSTLDDMYTWKIYNSFRKILTIQALNSFAAFIDNITKLETYTKFIFGSAIMQDKQISAFWILIKKNTSAPSVF